MIRVDVTEYVVGRSVKGNGEDAWGAIDRV